VFKARQVSLNRTVAIKVLPLRFSKDADYVERFYREGEAAAKLNHPNIVQAIDIGEANGYHYFVMEYIEGHTVYDELAGGKVYPEAEALRVAIQMALALDHAHAVGLIHRDVKPKNIMITGDGVAKLADMGLARAVADTQAAQAEAGLLFGTPYYISPEQIIGKQDVDFRADIYALGATLYHMVTGRVPYQADDARGVMLKHLKEPLVSPDKYNLDLSFGICKVIKKMMAKHRKSRHDSTAEMLRDLESVDFLLEADSPDGSSAAGTVAFSPADLEVPKFEAPTSKTVQVPPAKTKPSARGAADARQRGTQPTVPVPPPRAPQAPLFNTLSWVLLIVAVVSVLLNALLLLTW
jgi:serine/threonine-protein kinase